MTKKVQRELLQALMRICNECDVDLAEFTDRIKDVGVATYCTTLTIQRGPLENRRVRLALTVDPEKEA